MNIHMLIKAGVDIHAKDVFGAMPHNYAAEENNVDVLAVMLEHGADVNNKDSSGFAALHRGCHGNRFRYIAWVVLEYGKNVDVNIRAKDGYMPIHFCARYGMAETVEQLIEAGADIEVKNNSGHTPLHKACKNENENVVKVLIEAGARLNTAEKNKKCIRPILEELKARRAVYRTKLLDLDFPKEVVDNTLLPMMFPSSTAKTKWFFW